MLCILAVGYLMAGMNLLQLLHRRIAACYTLQTIIAIALDLHHPVVLADSRTS
jgi:hypothetical protein